MLGAHRCPHLAALKNITHGFFTRIGGVSTGWRWGLDAGRITSPPPADIAANRTHMLATLGTTRLALARQVHGTSVAAITSPTETPRADALVTTETNLALGIRTADCAPVLFVDAEAGVIAAAHAGWRGLLAGILEATVETMVKLHAKPERIVCTIGPCIHQPAYAVREDFVQTFLAQDPASAPFFSPDRRTFNLPGYANARLAHAGVNASPLLADSCTASNPKTFFSYRTATHRKSANYGLQLSALAQLSTNPQPLS